MQEAIEKLRASSGHTGLRGAAALYALPWYMIIGPSAAGKSTLLRNSNLHFPYSVNDQIDIKGFAGTRNCDWWFADEAIILDTAGRYAVEQKDQAEWLAFLKLLRKHRPKSPINGVIVALSLEEILAAHNQELTAHTRLIRHKLEELNRELGIVIPVTLVITKCDLLDGFLHFFKDLSPETREQAFGVCLQGNDFDQALNRLVDKLKSWRLHKLSLSSQLEHKHEVINLPQSFEEAVKKITHFLEELSRKNHYEEQPLFKGIFFSSATQILKRLDQSGQRVSLLKNYSVKSSFSSVRQQRMPGKKDWAGFSISALRSLLPA